MFSDFFMREVGFLNIYFFDLIVTDKISYAEMYHVLCWTIIE
jgi:hypothetical protein